MKTVISLLVVLLLVAPAFAGERWSGQVAGLVAPCGSEWPARVEDWPSATWRNESGVPLWIREARIWFGFNYRGVTDIAAYLVRERDGNTLVWAPFDHYADPSQPMIVTNTFTPDYVRLDPGDAVILRLFCNGFVPDNGLTGAASAWLSVVTEKPN